MATNKLRYFFSSIVVVGLAVAITGGGCGKKAQDKTDTDVTPNPTGGKGSTGSPKKAAPWIKADPNPVPVSEGTDKGTTTISWDTGDGSDAQVILRIAGQKDKVFSGGSRFKAEANWIKKGVQYDFILFAGKEREKELAKVTITAK